MHIRGQLDDGIRVGNGGFRYRVDDRGQGVRGLDREIHHAGAGCRAVGDGDLDAHTSRRQRTGVERKLPSARVDTCTWSVFWATAETRVSGSPSGSLKLLSALAV